MGGRYDQSELNVYGAEDDEEMDAILDALERANREEPAGPQAGKAHKRRSAR